MNIYSRVETITETQAAGLAALFGALADTSRVRIVAALLPGELSVQQIAEQIGLSHSAVSHQLRGLRQLRMVRARKSGRQVFYAIDDSHVSDLLLRGIAHLEHE